MFKEPIINVYIPYEPEYRLGAAYNRIMQESAHEWNLLLDHDVILLNPQWYNMCQQAILYLERESKPAGIITAMTNAFPLNFPNGYLPQISYRSPKTTDIAHHKQWADYLYNRYNGIIREVCWPLAFGGCFMLTNKTAWATSGGFADEYQCDFDYCDRLHRNGFKQYILPGLYIYHATDGRINERERKIDREKRRIEGKLLADLQ